MQKVIARSNAGVLQKGHGSCSMQDEVDGYVTWLLRDTESSTVTEM